MKDDDHSRALQALNALLQQALGGDPNAAEKLWSCFESLARALAKLADSRPSTREYANLRAVLMRCAHQLGNGLIAEEAGALEAIYGLTESCCRLIQASANRNAEFVAAFAEQSAVWPVLLARKQAFHISADAYLASIRVGEKSITPTTIATRIEATDRWTELATMLIENISVNRRLLLREKSGIKSASKFEQTIEADRLQRHARHFPQACALKTPWYENKTEWWKIAKQMLNFYWQENPVQAAADWKFAGKAEGEKNKSYAIRKVHGAFNSLSKQRKSQ